MIIWSCKNQHEQKLVFGFEILQSSYQTTIRQGGHQHLLEPESYFMGSDVLRIHMKGNQFALFWKNKTKRENEISVFLLLWYWSMWKQRDDWVFNNDQRWLNKVM